MNIFAILLGIALLILVVFGYPVVILRPLLKQVKHGERPHIKKRFLLTDLFSLAFVAQLPLSIMSFAGADASEILGVVFVIVVTAVVVWYVALKHLNHIGVTDSWKRFVGISFTIPCAILGGISLPVVLGTMFETVDPDSFPWKWLWCLLFCLLSGFNFFLARWIASNSLTELHGEGGSSSKVSAKL